MTDRDTPEPRKKYFIETWGCQMNEHDSQRLAGQLHQQGFSPARLPEEADVILLNSCSVREKAQHKVYSRLGEFRALKLQKRNLRIGLCGCVAQQEGEAALERVSHLDFVLGPGRVGELRHLLAQIEAGQRLVVTGFPEERAADLDSISHDGSYKGMVTVIEGCNKKCTFCIVPSTRGPERSRPLHDILAEVRGLLEHGFVEIELLGQTVNHWRDPELDLDFSDLLEAVASIPGVERLRFVTSYPRDFTPRMVEKVGVHPNICPYIHLPVQSGSDRILRRMGRGYTIEEYRQLVASLRTARRGLALSTDIIVGFPGETEEDFALTMQLLAEVRFAVVFAFCYSDRPGTAAPKLDGRVPSAVAEGRLQTLFALQNEIQRQLNEELVGQEMDVLITGRGKGVDHLIGRTTCHRIVQVHGGGEVPHGQLHRVRIERALSHCLFAASTGSSESPRPFHPAAKARRLVVVS